MEIQNGATGMEVRVGSVDIVSVSNCSDKIKALNNDFGNLINEMKKNKIGNNKYIKNLKIS
jgi:hypothetical protein